MIAIHDARTHASRHRCVSDWIEADRGGTRALFEALKFSQQLVIERVLLLQQRESYWQPLRAATMAAITSSTVTAKS